MCSISICLYIHVEMYTQMYKSSCFNALFPHISKYIWFWVHIQPCGMESLFTRWQQRPKLVQDRMRKWKGPAEAADKYRAKLVDTLLNVFDWTCTWPTKVETMFAWRRKSKCMFVHILLSVFLFFFLTEA